MKHDPTTHHHKYVGATGGRPFHRKSLRLKHFDYSQNGAYFITLCSHNRLCLFGEINNKEMLFNPFGKIVRDEWIKSPLIRAEIKLDEFIVMPNHLHGIVFIHTDTDQNKNNKPTVSIGPKNKSISSLIAGFKSAATKKINELRKSSDLPVWQRNYHEHIIRNEKSLEEIRKYVIHNPQTWEKDSLFSE